MDKITRTFYEIALDVFQVMPNHMHGIIVINDFDVGATLAVAPGGENDPDMRPGTDVGATPAVAPVGVSGPDMRPGTDVGATLAVAPGGVSGPDMRPGTDVGATLAVAPGGDNDPDMRPGTGASPAPTDVNATIGGIVGAYKSLVANTCLNLFKTRNETMGKLWQRNYHEHIIRDEQSYQTIFDYIINNPDKWNDDKFFVP